MHCVTCKTWLGSNYKDLSAAWIVAYPLLRHQIQGLNTNISIPVHSPSMLTPNKMTTGSKKKSNTRPIRTNNP